MFFCREKEKERRRRSRPCPDPGPLVPPGLQVPGEGLHAPLVAGELLRILVLHKLPRVLVDRVVGQVDELVVQVVLVDGERLCGEPDQAVVIQIELDRVYAGQQDVPEKSKIRSKIRGT